MSLTVDPDRVPEAALTLPGDADTGRAILGGGCFWCTEAVYLNVDGVLRVTSGYAGGSADTANYDAVCSGTTDHAEVVEVVYDPHRVRYTDLLRLFFAVAHDPTQRNRQGNDIGRQYRSAIFYENPAQADTAGAYIRQLDAARVFAAPIVTTLEPLRAFHPAETYHQDYARRNPDQPYIRFAAQPKVEKLRQWFRDRLKQRGTQ